MGNTNAVHGTVNEKKYIDSLIAGNYRKVGICKISKAQLLKNYIKSTKRRMEAKTLGSIDGKEVVKYAQKLLRSL